MSINGRVSTRMYYAIGEQSMGVSADGAYAWQRKLASGQRIDRASEDPAAAGRAVILSARLSRIDMFKASQDFANSNLQDLDTGLDAMQNQLAVLREIGAQAGNATLNSSGYAALKSKADASIEELRKVALQKDSSGRPFFDNDAASELEVQAGVSVNILLARASVFGTGTNLNDSALMAAAQGISTALSQNRMPTTAELDALNSAQDLLVTARTTVGLNANATDNARSAVEAYELGTLAQKSDLLDTDIAKGVSEFSRNVTLLEAARSLFSKFNSTGLFGLLR